MEGLITIQQLQEQLQGQEIRVRKVLEENQFITTRPTTENADIFLLLEEVVAKIKNQIVEVWVENKFEWTLRIMNNSILDVNATEYKINRCRERIREVVAC